MDFNLAHFLYEEDSLAVFLLVSVVLGGGAAWMSGRAIASTWRPAWHVGAYMLILGAALRFIHYALFEGTLLSPHYFLVDSAICILIGFIGFRATRSSQMVGQYRWLYVPAGLLRWAPRQKG